MAAIYLAVAEVTSVDGIEKNGQQMSMSVLSDSGGPVAGDLAQIKDALQAVFNTTTGGVTVGQLTSSHLRRSTGAHSLKLYDITTHLSGTPHGSPVATTTWTIEDNATGISLPPQVSCKATFRAFSWDEQPVERADGADPGTAVDRPRQRYTGGVFMPTPNSEAADIAGSGISRPKLAYRTAVNQGWDAAQIILLANTMSLGIWSRSDANVRPAELVQCDDRWDTQRKRNVARTVVNSVTLG